MTRKKDQTLLKSGTAIGIELHEGTEFRPNLKKLRNVWNDILSIAAVEQCTALDAMSVTGTLQWFDLLVRAKLAGCLAVYAFGRRTPDSTLCHVPPNVIEE